MREGAGIKISEQKQDYIDTHFKTMTDIEMAYKLKIAQSTVRNYRTKVRHLRNEKFTFNQQKEAAIIELNALVAFNYQGIMFESVSKRINFLSNIVQL